MTQQGGRERCGLLQWQKAEEAGTTRKREWRGQEGRVDLLATAMRGAGIDDGGTLIGVVTQRVEWQRMEGDVDVRTGGYSKEGFFARGKGRHRHIAVVVSDWLGETTRTIFW